MAVPVERATSAAQWARALDRALEEALDVLVEPVSGEAFVESGSRPGVLYAVSASSCSCPAGSRGIPCKHRACYLFQIGELPVDGEVSPADCPACSGCGQQWYRAGYALPCESCGGSGVKPDHRLAGAPVIQPVAASAA